MLLYQIVLVLTLMVPTADGNAKQVIVDAPDRFRSLDQCHLTRDKELMVEGVIDAQCVYRTGA